MPGATDLGSGSHIDEISHSTVVRLLKVGHSARSSYFLRSYDDQHLIPIYA